MTIGLATSELTGFSCELALYGVMTVLTLGSAYVLVIVRRADRINWPMLICTILMFVLCTAHVAVTGQRIFNAFIPGDAVTRTTILRSLSEPLYSAKTAIFFIMLIFGDVIVIYRCYLVWGRNLWIVLVPILCSLASGVLAFWAVWATVNPKKPGATAALAHSAEWGTALLTLSLIANLWSVLGITYRIFSYERRFAETQRVTGFRAFRRQSFIPFASIIVESGALNAAFLIVYTVALDRTPSVLRVMADCAPTVVGVVFNLVIIRLSINPKRENDISRSQAAASTLVYVRNLSKQSMAPTVTVDTTTTAWGDTGEVRSIALDMPKYRSAGTDLEMNRFSERDHK